MHTHTHTHSNIVFQGQLYQGEAKSKSWSAMCSGQVTVYLQQMGGSGGEGSWQLVAFKGDDKVCTQLQWHCSSSLEAFKSGAILLRCGKGVWMQASSTE